MIASCSPVPAPSRLRKNPFLAFTSLCKLLILRSTEADFRGPESLFPQPASTSICMPGFRMPERCSMPHHRHASAIFDTVSHSLPANRSCICRICSLALRDGIAGRLRNTAYFEIGNGQWLELWGAPTRRVLWTLRIWQRMCFEESIS